MPEVRINEWKAKFIADKFRNKAYYGQDLSKAMKESYTILLKNEFAFIIYIMYL